MSGNRKIQILDTTLRDGEQAPGYSMNLKEKLEVARQLERLGVDVIEAGFPVSSEEDFHAVEEISKVVKRSVVAGFGRCVMEDVRRTWAAIQGAARPRLHIFIATSEIHMEYKLKMARQEVLERIAETVAYAKSLCEDVEFSAEDATRSDRGFLLQALNTAIRAGATVVNVADTVGYITPPEMYSLVSWLKENLEAPVPISIHVHNDLGMGVANTLAAVEAGAEQVECTINGIGERAGNVALEEVAMALHTRRDHYHVETGINLRQIYRASKLLSTITGVGLPPNKPIVGANAFAHESGIHQHGMMASRQTYEILNPEEIGIYQSQMVLGKHSGRHAFAQRVEELGYLLPKEAMDKAFERFKLLAERRREITDRDIEAVLGSSAVLGVKETYSLKTFVINSGTIISATAVVCLIKDGTTEIENVARGEGPVDAAFKAIDGIVNMDTKLESWTIRTITEGGDALGEAVSKLSCNGHPITGRGLAPDAIEASIRSYVNAINKALAMGES